MRPVVHFEILADDLDRAQAFYEAVFGWKVRAPGLSLPYRQVATHEPGTPGIDGAIMGRHFPQAVICTVQVEDLEAAIERVEATGGSVRHGPHTVPEVGRVVYVADTEGNLVGMIEPLA